MKKVISISIIFLLLPAVLFAHGVHGNGFISGITHPILGLDHFLAIIATGVLGYISNKEKWYLPSLMFVLGMIVSGYFGIGNEATLFIEKVIAMSILFTGVFILLHEKTPFFMLLIFSLVFGSFHGYAHGAEMSASVNFQAYISGYTLGAIILSVAGMWLIKTLISTIPNKFNSVWLIAGVFIGSGIVVLFV